MAQQNSYKDTVNLPKTDFSMRANSIKREPELQQFWQDQKVYETLSDNNPGEVFVLHDGPPYANGALHMGHALNKILKDIINKYQLLQGRKVRYVPGWDCHGLPIELKVIQKLKSKERAALTPLKLRQKARDFALSTFAEQRDGFKRYGIWGDWENPYLTLKPEYEAAQIGVFGKMALKGYIYRGLKAVHWSPSSKTALAEAELEYPEGHTSRSIYAAFPMTKLAPAVQDKLGEFMPNLGVAIWTTTPWTLPGNLAVAINPGLTYAVVEVNNPISHQYLLVAEDLVASLAEKFGYSLTVKTTVKGSELEHCTYKHPLFDRESNILIGGDYITTESGTGLVHTAPGHGQEDFIVGQKYGLPILSPVDGDGNFTEEAGPFQGLNVLKDANEAIITALSDSQALLLEEAYVHKYPYDWRTKKPTIFRATEQWFASVKGFREEALKAIDTVEWIPAQGKNRITPMVSERADWCISRQRSWGVPIPVFYEEETDEPLLTQETINHVQEIIAEKGSDAWWELSVEELLPEKYRNNGKTYRKGTDTMDVWFDSGSSWAAVADRREALKYPVDMYLEGSDQHRGWFQSSLLTSVAVNGVAPYQTVLTHGFALDEQGRKMSKSLGNVVDPNVIIKGGNNQKKEPPYGADVLRLWVSSVDYSSDVPIGQNIIKQLADVYRKIRNTARFLLGNLHDFNPETDAVAYGELPELDRYMLHRMTEVFSEVTKAFDSYQFFRFFQTVQNFCVVDLSNFYLDVAKDRLYISDANSLRRRSCQTVLAVAIENLAKSIAPVLCHMAEDIWQSLPYKTPHGSVFASGWVKMSSEWEQPELTVHWTKLRQLRNEVNKVMERARSEKAIGASLDAKVLLYVPDSEFRALLADMNPTGQSEMKKDEETDLTVSSIQSFLEANLKAQQAAIEANLKAQQAAIEANLSTISTTEQEKEDQPESIQAILAAQKIATEAILNPQKAVREANLQAHKMTLDANLELQKVTLDTNLKGQSEASLSDSTMSTDTAKQPVSNHVDALRYLFLASQVELVDSGETVQKADYTGESELVSVGIVPAEGEKCDRCWNYSTQVGESSEHPTLCERCVGALAGTF
ncbi:isoleucine--tRNA ligase [Spirulina sp. CS-785/01]|uniref:isoleucine--tRNA ligase n=1 Tax=Spirulina sp. CS-785/01 TaxID=3021716 RepID=UPI00232CFA62|nr:isoleucine--tRNA ligase [Spirulina sp. CS-785/01]MDB9316045.1 isoleucine--tRNA ligase [Spirulina sp. CS-785/01]